MVSRKLKMACIVLFSYCQSYPYGNIGVGFRCRKARVANSTVGHAVEFYSSSSFCDVTSSSGNAILICHHSPGVATIAELHHTSTKRHASISINPLWIHWEIIQFKIISQSSHLCNRRRYNWISVSRQINYVSQHLR